jgi:hypothetical protein
MNSSEPKGRLCYSIKPPQDWMVETLALAITVVRSPDWEAFSSLEFLVGPESQKSVSEILAKGRFYSTSFFPKAQPPKITEAPNNDSATALVQFTTRKGSAGRATLRGSRQGNMVVIQAQAAPDQLYTELLPVLEQSIRLPDSASAQPADDFSLQQWHMKHVAAALRGLPVQKPAPPDPDAAARTDHPPPQPPVQSPPPLPDLRNFSTPGNFRKSIGSMEDYIKTEPASPHPPMGPPKPAGPPPLPDPYVKFTEPEKGTFTMEVPRGWHVKGGFNHPMPGDRRPWFEAVSPDGIYIACDPAVPQNLCHFRDQAEGQFAVMAAGGQLLNLKPSAERLGDFYVEHVASRLPGPLQKQQRRARPDMVELLKSQFQQNGVALAPKFQITCDEMIFQFNKEGKPVVLSVLSSGAFNGEYNMWTWAFWEGNVYVYIAPPHLTARAEEVRAHMKRTVQLTKNLVQIYQQDEAQIAAGGRAAHAAQLNWFGQQQSLHSMQTALGDSIVANYGRNR